MFKLSGTTPGSGISGPAHNREGGYTTPARWPAFLFRWGCQRRSPVVIQKERVTHRVNDPAFSSRDLPGHHATGDPTKQPRGVLARGPSTHAEIPNPLEPPLASERILPHTSPGGQHSECRARAHAHRTTRQPAPGATPKGTAAPPAGSDELQPARACSPIPAPRQAP